MDVSIKQFLPGCWIQLAQLPTSFTSATYFSNLLTICSIRTDCERNFVGVGREIDDIDAQHDAFDDFDVDGDVDMASIMMSS